MKNIIKFAIASVLLLQASMLRAQGAHVSVESLIGFPDTALYNEQYTFSVFLHNYDSTAFQGYVAINFYIDSANGSNGTFIGPYQIYIGPDSFASIPIVGFMLDNSSFKMGGNVVVVWPVSSGAPEITMTDTFYTYVDVVGTAGISDYLPEEKVNIYPVPANNILFLPQNTDGRNIEYLKVFDMLGRTRVLLKNYPESISVAEFENGCYILEIKDKSGKINITKFSVNH